MQDLEGNTELLFFVLHLALVNFENVPSGGEALMGLEVQRSVGKMEAQHWTRSAKCAGHFLVLLSALHKKNIKYWEGTLTWARNWWLLRWGVKNQMKTVKRGGRCHIRYTAGFCELWTVFSILKSRGLSGLVCQNK